MESMMVINNLLYSLHRYSKCVCNLQTICKFKMLTGVIDEIVKCTLLLYNIIILLWYADLLEVCGRLVLLVCVCVCYLCMFVYLAHSVYLMLGIESQQLIFLMQEKYKQA